MPAAIVQLRLQFYEFGSHVQHTEEAGACVVADLRLLVQLVFLWYLGGDKSSNNVRTGVAIDKCLTSAKVGVPLKYFARHADGNCETMRRAVLVTSFTFLLLAVAGGVAGASDGSESSPEWVFPLVGQDRIDFVYSGTFGAPRGGGRTHHGVDIMTYGKKGVPVVAAADGVIKYVNWSWTPDNLNPDRCCTLAIQHADGWETWYIHLNNDTPGTDDGDGWGIAPGILPGVEVTAGQLIGWNGDSGNAENTGPHLHWEVHFNGTVVNPTPHADAALRISAPIPGVYYGAFWDDEGSVHETNIDLIAELGITRGCNPPDNDRFCPDREITRGEIAAFIRRILLLPTAVDDYFTDDNGTTFEADINALAAVGIAFGCTETKYCPSAPLRREEMAELLVRTFEYGNPDSLDLFSDDEASPFQASINALGVNGITKGCNPPLNDEFCPTRTLNRAEMATFFARALGIGT